MTDFETMKDGERALLEITEIITDKKQAMLMLCKTPKAWAYISPELKADHDVQMCYQPTGYVSEIIYEKGGHDYSLGKDVYAEPGFEFYQTENYGKFLVPVWAKQLEKFNYAAYCSIQYAMNGKDNYCQENWPTINPVEFMRASAYFTNKVEEYPFKGINTYTMCRVLHVFDRSQIKKSFGNFLGTPETHMMQDKK